VELFVKEVKDKNPDMVFWLGDNPGHNVYQQTKETQSEYFKYIVRLLRESEYPGKVYGILGNHDCFPPSQFDIYNNDDEWLAKEFTEALSPWYDENTREVMAKYGYFAQMFPGTKLKVIGLNSQVNDFANMFLMGNSTDPLQQLKWLEQELSKSEANKESIMILGHVGPQSKSGTNCNTTHDN
jgi:sphingomyelin phosphodiesterase